MREIEYTNQFSKDYKRESRVPNNRDLDQKLELILNVLCNDQAIPKSFKDHSLKGIYSGTRECHIKPDLLLVYIKGGKVNLTLVRLGSHSELF
jgi:mRNA interferase YafQ